SEESFILNPHTSTGLSVMVTIPPVDSLEADSDNVTVTAISNGDPSLTSAAELTTLVKPREVFLPLLRNQ
ncbi:MAG: hypothetical protein IBX69_18945, partial [Anaerolineales bacterium]|nr:hypothetical protein [Anaerolineales bacterium]